MSISAINWAGRTITGSASRKAVLICLANYANEQNEAYPSVDTIARITELDAKTVRSSLRRLAEDGHISDTGRRRGQTQNIRVWALQVGDETLPKTEGYQKRNPTENARQTLPKTPVEPYQKRVAEPKGEPIGYTKECSLGSRYSREPKPAPLIAPRSSNHTSLDYMLDRPEPKRYESATEARIRRALELDERINGEADRKELESIAEYFSKEKKNG